MCIYNKQVFQYTRMHHGRVSLLIEFITITIYLYLAVNVKYSLLSASKSPSGVNNFVMGINLEFQVEHRRNATNFISI